MSTKTQAKPLFAATLTPHRSLSPRGKRVVIGLVVAAGAGAGHDRFMPLGAWPVVGFMGLDVVAIWVALTISMRSGKAYEVMTLWPDTLELKQVDAKGQEDVLSFEPFNVRFVIDRDYNERVTGLWLQGAATARCRSARSSAPTKSSALSKVFGTALRKARA